ncbi:transcriptional regulator [Embleya sp. NBC_00896]|uniref:transcriptional regulator n=1 Tax=Embleya sp. NBC_00896 TaxID=2975961 RepID=UPI002F90E3C8|nr:transcriptional regulator [Embleya sp. NBC_00896]
MAAPGPLTALMPTRGPGLDLRTLVGDSPSLDEGIENLLAVPGGRLRKELGHLTFAPAYSTWVRDFLDGGLEPRREFAEALRACHEVTVAPFHDRVRSHLEAARSHYAHTLLDGGVEGLLAGLSVPLIRWDPPVLELHHPREHDIRLGGRGLVIAPTLFVWREMTVLWDAQDETAPYVLAVPTVRDLQDGVALWERGAADGRALGALLGQTRAAALTVINDFFLGMPTRLTGLNRYRSWRIASTMRPILYGASACVTSLGFGVASSCHPSWTVSRTPTTG